MCDKALLKVLSEPGTYSTTSKSTHQSFLTNGPVIQKDLSALGGVLIPYGP